MFDWFSSTPTITYSTTNPNIQQGLVRYNFGGYKQLEDGTFGFEGPMPQGQSGIKTLEEMKGMTGYNPYTNTYATINNGSSDDFLGLSGNTWAGLGGVAQGLSGLASAYLGLKNYQLAQDQFKFQKGLANRNLANQAKIINNTYDNAAQVAAGMIGGKDASGNYGMTNQSIVDRYANRAREKHVDGSAI